MTPAESGHQAALTAALLRFSEQLTRRGIAWLLLRNDEAFPAPRTRYSDIDMLIDPECRDAARELFLEAFKEIGLSIAVAVKHLDGGLESYFVSCVGGPSLHVDLFWQISFRGRPLYPADALLQARQMVGARFSPRSGHGAAIACASYCLRHGKVKDEYREKIREAARDDRQGMCAFFAYRLGARQAEEIVIAIETGDWPRVATLLRPLRSTGILGRICHAGHAARNLLQRLAFRSPGLFVAFMGPDGAGKSTLIKAFAARMDTLYLPGKQRVMHWRPRLLPGPGELISATARGASDVTQPQLKPPYGFGKSLARLAYFTLDYLLGGLAVIYPALLKGHLIVGDRYFHDMWLDRRRYRLGLPCGLIRAAGILAPRPDLTFILTAPAAVLHGRKQELSIEETARQLTVLSGLAERMASAHLVDVDRPVEGIVDELEALCIQFLAARTRRQFFPQPAHGE